MKVIYSVIPDERIDARLVVFGAVFVFTGGSPVYDKRPRMRLKPRPSLGVHPNDDQILYTDLTNGTLYIMAGGRKVKLAPHAEVHI